MMAATTLSLSSTYKTSIRKGQKGATHFIKKENLAQVFSCEFCEVFKNTSFAEHLRTTASEMSSGNQNSLSEFLYSVFFRIRIEYGPEKHRIRTFFTQFY